MTSTRLKRGLGHLLIALAVAITTAPRAAAQADWLPPSMIEGLTAQLVERFETIHGKRAADRDGLTNATRTRVERLRTVVNAWRADGIAEHAPKPARITLPSTGNVHLDAMRRYQLCSVVQMQEYESSQVIDVRQRAAGALTGLTVLQARLIDPFLRAGGTEAQVEAALTGPPMRDALTRMLAEPALLDHVHTTCAPIVAELLGMMG